MAIIKDLKEAKLAFEQSIPRTLLAYDIRIKAAKKIDEVKLFVANELSIPVEEIKVEWELDSDWYPSSIFVTYYVDNELFDKDFNKAFAERQKIQSQMYSKFRAKYSKELTNCFNIHYEFKDD